MGCSSCGSTSATPKGCKSHGHCKSGGCNKMNSFDWLSWSIEGSGIMTDSPIYEISFHQGDRKWFYKNPDEIDVMTGDWVVVESNMGYDVGRISLSGDLVRLQMRKKKVKDNHPEIRKIIRRATERDLEVMEQAQNLEHETLVKARVIARSLGLDMKIGHVAYQGDGKKAIFFYTAEGRVDFRELIKSYAREFRVKIEMKQIGARQEAGLIGGIGSCGRELCCSTWLTDFKSVSTHAARYQSLSINLSKLSGQCGRLKCCLNYELDTYLEASKSFPEKADKLLTEAGTAYLQKTDILTGWMWYSYPEQTAFIPLRTDQVKDILEKNKLGQKAPALTELSQKVAVIDQSTVYPDLVGQVSLKSLDKGKRKKKKKKKPDQRNTNHKKENHDKK